MKSQCVCFSSRRRHTRCGRDWSSDVCSSDLPECSSLWHGGNKGPGYQSDEHSGAITQCCPQGMKDRKSVVEGKSVDLGGRRIIKKKKIEQMLEEYILSN